MFDIQALTFLIPVKPTKYSSVIDDIPADFDPGLMREGYLAIAVRNLARTIAMRKINVFTAVGQPAAMQESGADFITEN